MTLARFPLLALLLGLVWSLSTGCLFPPPDGGTPVDGGQAVDGGGRPTDGGPATDGGASSDAGTLADGGLHTDGGASPDGGQTNRAPVANAGDDRTVVVGATVDLDGSSSSDPDGDALTFEWTLTGQPTGSTAVLSTPTGVSSSFVPDQEGAYVVRLVVDDGTESSAPVVVTLTAVADLDLPPDPADVAPALPANEEPTIEDRFAFLYTGVDPIQTGADVGAFEPRRLAVVRGRLIDTAGDPLPGVEVSVKDHAEWGQTLSRADGVFDLVVNGGGQLVIVFQRSGYLSAQRRVRVRWNDTLGVDDVALVALDEAMTMVTLGGTSPMQVAMGSVVSDDDGMRQAAILFPENVTATYQLPDGTTMPLTTLSVRATEYTVGERGLAAMPGVLPPASAYTYAVDLTVDEAMEAGATRVDFSEPLPVYVDNFLGFPTGSIAPLGYYDDEVAAWVPADNGLVIEILAEVGGLAEVDLDGSGLAADANARAAIGMTDTELAELAATYAPGQSLTRMPISHFTPWDCNFPFIFPDDPDLPDDPLNGDRNDDDDERNNRDDCGEAGSIISCQSQTLGEVVPIVGTPFALHYSSSRMAGRLATASRDFIITGAEPPTGLVEARLRIDVAGQTTQMSFGPEANQTFPWTWDGRDAFGRLVQGESLARIELEYGYELVYAPALSSTLAFAQYADVLSGVTGYPEGRVVGLVSTVRAAVVGGRWLAPDDLGGWTLTPHHRYGPLAGELLRGDGGWRRVATPDLASSPIEALVGNPTSATTGDDGPAVEASIQYASGIAVGPDGSLYIADEIAHRVRRVDPSGVITTFAGNGVAANTGDGLPATAASVLRPRAVVVAPDQSVYIATGHPVVSPYLIRRVRPDGVIETVVGGGSERLFTTNGRPLFNVAGTDVDLYPIPSMSVDTEGSVVFPYQPIGPFEFRGGTQFVRLSPDGRLTPFRVSQTTGVNGIQVGKRWFINDDGAFISVDPDLQGGGVFRLGAGGDLQRLAAAPPENPLDPFQDGLYSIAQSPSGAIFVANETSIYRVHGGNLVPVAGGTRILNVNQIVNGVPAAGAGFGQIRDIAFDDDGKLYVADAYGYKVRVIAPVPPIAAPVAYPGTTAIAAEDGSELYLFDDQNRHVYTLQALTGALLYRFTYDAEGLLTAVIDGDDRATTIERDADGRPTAIVAPGGQRTVLSLNADGYLSAIENPAGEVYGMGYGDGGLLSSFTRPSGSASTYTFDAAGRLIGATDAAGGTQTLQRSRDPASGVVTVTRTSPLGAVTTYQTEKQPDGTLVKTIAFPGGRDVITTDGPGASSTVSSSSGMTYSVTQGPDPRWGMMAPVVTSITTSTGGGLTSTLNQQQALVLSDPLDVFSIVSLTQTVDVNGRITTVAYDGAARSLTTTTPGGQQLVSVLDERGRVTSLRSASWSDEQTYAYDAEGRMTSMVHGNQSVTFAYDAQNELISRTDAAGRTTAFDHDAAGRIVALTRPDASVVSFAYDANGNRTAVTMPGLQQHAQTYSLLDRRSSYTPPGSSGPANAGLTFVYDLDRGLERKTLPSGREIENSFDDAHVWMGITYPEAAIDFGFDGLADRIVGLDRVVTTIGADQSLAYGYDGSLMTSATFSGAAEGAFAYAYDNNFQLVSIDLSSGADVAQDAIGRNLDGDITSYGPFALTRAGPGGLVSELTDGTV